jgi:Flp pilus assembly protein TadD
MQDAGDLDATAKTYREVLATYPNNLTAINNLAYLLVTAEPPVFAPAEALKYAERLRARITADESTASALDTIGWVYFNNNENDLALAALEEALSLGGPTPMACLHLGAVYQKLNRLPDARATFRQGLELARQAGNPDEIRQLEDALKKLP